MKKLIKNEIYGSINSTHIHCSLQKVSIYSYCSINSNAILQKRVKTKKKEKKKEQKHRVKNVDVNKLNTNTHLIVRLYQRHNFNHNTPYQW